MTAHALGYIFASFHYAKNTSAVAKAMARQDETCDLIEHIE